ncbi:hypothetical protein [Paraflavitalea sp. CAU 1676]|uniref:hypothetical protein n=1 Tax=Paraflavitalea sp. CAU 1676 TaxID=3032598 RepID=UPI0023DC97E2|nr:hypothetical protein [Paraflavitalea sp. CAU 1676]MDF2192537.1 hypothetical protein [Paraflavitalea sp. CAU 1676]
MSTRFEQFMRDHREDFDSDEPAPQVWTKLEKELKPREQKGKVLSMKIMRWSVAAAIMVLAGLGVYHLFVPNGKVGPDNNAIVQDEKSGKKQSPEGDVLLKDINPTYAKEVYHFTQLIELKQSELKQIEKDNPTLYKQFLQDISRLDSSYNTLKSELPTNANREQLLEAMIQNLRLQTELLNQQLQIIQQIKKSKSGNNESNGKIV